MTAAWHIRAWVATPTRSNRSIPSWPTPTTRRRARAKKRRTSGTCCARAWPRWPWRAIRREPRSPSTGVAGESRRSPDPLYIDVGPHEVAARQPSSGVITTERIVAAPRETVRLTLRFGTAEAQSAPPAKAWPARAAAPSDPAPTLVGARRSSDALEPRAESRFSIPTLVFAGIGAAFLATAATFAVLGQRENDSVTRAVDSGSKFPFGEDSAGRRDNTLGGGVPGRWRRGGHDQRGALRHPGIEPARRARQRDAHAVAGARDHGRRREPGAGIRRCAPAAHLLMKGAVMAATRSTSKTEAAARGGTWVGGMVVFGLAFALTAVACYDPMIADGHLTCAANPDCPSGFFCATTCSGGLCYHNTAAGQELAKTCAVVDTHGTADGGTAGGSGAGAGGIQPGGSGGGGGQTGADGGGSIVRQSSERGGRRRRRRRRDRRHGWSRRRDGRRQRRHAGWRRRHERCGRSDRDGRPRGLRGYDRPAWAVTPARAA